MEKQKSPNPLMVILLVLGFIIIIAGVYFVKKDMTSSGVTMGKYGRPYGTGTIDGKGMIFCGILIAGFGLIFKDKNKEDDHF
ncbi:MAG: hypothetical protein Q8L81_12675 [Bacteroidota bacterium]|nr:hypothetical protein [Bacteroidota bacterium]